MSQKTNPISLRLQKTNLSFPLSLFADYFWSDIYQTLFENKKYLSAFVKESDYSQAIFSARVFYRKFSLFLFVQDNRLSKKNALFFFKNKGDKSMSPKISPFTENQGKVQPLTKKEASLSSALSYVLMHPTSHKKDPFFNLVNQKESIEVNNTLKSKPSFPSTDTYNTPPLVLKRYDQKQWLIKILQHDFLRIKQGFFVVRTRNKEFSFSSLRKSPFSVESSLGNCFFLDNMKVAPSQLPFAFDLTSLNKETISYNWLTMRDKDKSKILPLIKGEEISNYVDPRDRTIFRGEVDKKYRALSKKDISSPTKIFSGVEVKRPCFSFCEQIMSLKEKRLSFVMHNQNFLLNNAFFCYKKENEKRLQLLLSHGKDYDVDVKRKSPFFKSKSLPFGKNFSFFPRQTALEPIRFLNEDQNVMSVLDMVISLLEKRISFRQIKSFLFRQLSLKPQIKGIRISCSGRLGGRSKKAQKAKVQCDSFGTTTLSTFSSKIIFASKSAETSYGKIGVKIWLSYQDSW